MMSHGVNEAKLSEELHKPLLVTIIKVSFPKSSHGIEQYALLSVRDKF